MKKYMNNLARILVLVFLTFSLIFNGLLYTSCYKSEKQREELRAAYLAVAEASSNWAFEVEGLRKMPPLVVKSEEAATKCKPAPVLHQPVRQRVVIGVSSRGSFSDRDNPCTPVATWLSSKIEHERMSK